MVGAGNTGATMAAALLRMGRIRGVHRPAIAVPVPVPGSERAQLLVDAGATVDPEPEWLVQWALPRPRVRAGAPRRRRADGRAALERRRSRARATTLRKARVRRCSPSVKGFVGNVEGRDLLRGDAPT